MRLRASIGAIAFTAIVVPWAASQGTTGRSPLTLAFSVLVTALVGALAARWMTSKPQRLPQIGAVILLALAALRALRTPIDGLAMNVGGLSVVMLAVLWFIVGSPRRPRRCRNRALGEGAGVLAGAARDDRRAAPLAVDGDAPPLVSSLADGGSQPPRD